jgi:hypothetical protein
VLFFLQYYSAFRAAVIEQPVDVSFRYLAETAEIRTIGSVLVTDVVLLGAVLFILRRWTPPPGTFIVLFTVTAVAMSGLDSFERLPLALCAVIGGVAVDALVLRDVPARWVAVGAAVALWLPYFIVFKAAYNLPWTIHLWLGTAVLAALAGLGLSLLADPPVTPAPS